MIYSYKIYNLGGTNPYKEQLITRLKEKLDFSQLSNDQYFISDGIDYNSLGKEPTVAIYWAEEGKQYDNESRIQELQRRNIPIIPVVEDLQKAIDLLPSDLAQINAAELNSYDTDNHIEKITNSVLTFLGLLYKQNSIFISYRRAESEIAAKQIHIELVNNGYNAFLDKCDIDIGVDFQGVLKQRLSDCTVLLLLESDTFFDSKWTKEEYNTANKLRIGILDIKWPGAKTPRECDFFDSMTLSSNDFVSNGEFENNTLNSVVSKVNSLSARYYEARRQNIVGNFIKEVSALGHKAVQQVDGTIDIKGFPGTIVPLIGVPKSWDYYMADKKFSEPTFLLYDNQCILENWMNHLKWIEEKSKIQPIYVNDDSLWIKKNL